MSAVPAWQTSWHEVVLNLSQICRFLPDQPNRPILTHRPIPQQQPTETTDAAMPEMSDGTRPRKNSKRGICPCCSVKTFVEDVVHHVQQQHQQARFTQAEADAGSSAGRPRFFIHACGRPYKSQISVDNRAASCNEPIYVPGASQARVHEGAAEAADTRTLAEQHKELCLLPALRKPIARTLVPLFSETIERLADEAIKNPDETSQFNILAFIKRGFLGKTYKSREVTRRLEHYPNVAPPSASRTPLLLPLCQWCSKSNALFKMAVYLLLVTCCEWTVCLFGRPRRRCKKRDHYTLQVRKRLLSAQLEDIESPPWKSHQNTSSRRSRLFRKILLAALVAGHRISSAWPSRRTALSASGSLVSSTK